MNIYAADKLEHTQFRQPYPTVYHRWPSFSGRHCSCLEQSPWSCHVCTFRSCLSSGRDSKPTCLTFHTLPPCDCTVPAQWRLVTNTLDTLILLAYLLTYLLTLRGKLRKLTRKLSQ